MFNVIRNFFARRYARRPVDRVAHQLYVAVVDAARDPALYIEGGVADSLDGRFDMIALHMGLVMERLQQLRTEAESGDGAADGALMAELYTRLLEVHFADMDQSLREMGVGDLGVGKRVKAMARAFMGRREAYETAFAAVDNADDRTPLEDALVRNAYRGKPPGDDMVNWLSEYAVNQRRALSGRDFARIWAGEPGFQSAGSASNTITPEKPAEKPPKKPTDKPEHKMTEG